MLDWLVIPDWSIGRLVYWLAVDWWAEMIGRLRVFSPRTSIKEKERKENGEKKGKSVDLLIGLLGAWLIG